MPGNHWPGRNACSPKILDALPEGGIGFAQDEGEGVIATAFALEVGEVILGFRHSHIALVVASSVLDVSAERAGLFHHELAGPRLHAIAPKRACVVIEGRRIVEGGGGGALPGRRPLVFAGESAETDSRA